ncbi:MATE family efflux transporter [[Mycoplasma] gypis]|uniref:MATE family efflux transporter n=1 Tax=[Mycoplasma] gypis TaxID=92404 RepID=A0ABZ2RRM1_9BACT|nr:MATE family efflux transporter [[Mycoplasma] gypis]MBN0919243.1 multidrug transporter MATE [[Mycoplasma] gypis]
MIKIKKWNKKEIHGQDRAVELFEKTPIKKAIFIVAIPGLLTMLMMGLYSFFNQVFVLNFVPKTLAMFNGDLANQTGLIYSYLPENITALSRKEFDEIFSYYSQLISQNGLSSSNISSDLIASISVNATIPFVVFLNAVTFLIPMGTSVYYTKCISKKVEHTGKDLWATSFWMTIVCSAAATFIVFIAMWAGLVEVVSSHSKLESSFFGALNEHFADKYQNIKASDILTSYFDASHNMAVWWTKQYIYIYGAGNILQGLYVLLSYLIRAEGKNSYVMIWAILANIIGLVFDAILIIVLRMGILGGAIATIIGWFVNVGAYFIYIYRSNKKQTTWIDLKHIFKFKFRYRLLAPISLLGLSAFVRTFGVALTNFIITLLFNYLPYSDGFVNVYNWAKAAPSITLFFLALFGIADGTSSLLSYNYTQRNVKRVREIYWWSLLISFVYSICVYTIVAIFARYFAMILYVPEEKISSVVDFIRINMVRMVFYSMAIGGILLFRATNDIKMSILVTAMESFITFWFVMGAFVGIGFGMQKAGIADMYSSLMVSAGFAINALVTGIIIFTMSIHWLYKTLPHIDNVKMTWSLKIEKKFFDNAVIHENKINEELRRKQSNPTIQT